jgi:hypothetical protein
MLAPTPNSQQRVGSRDEYLLNLRLDTFRERWMQGESERRASDRKGAKLFRSQMWDDGVNPGRLAITANLGVALFDRVADSVLRGSPEPVVESINEDEDEPARILQGALVTNWRTRRMNELAKVGKRLSGFTRPIGWYVFWRHELNGGIGDFDTRIIPAHRLIVDDRSHRVADMEFVGFSERMTRAKLTMLFPDKADEIEAAAYASSSTVGVNDPLKTQNSSNSRVVDRLVSTATPPSFAPVTSIAAPGTKKNRDPLADEVDVEFLWIDDPTPKSEQRPKLGHDKRPLFEMQRDEDGVVVFEHDGYEVVDTPIGPIYQPNVKPKMHMVMEEAIVRKYKHRRHVARIPNDKVILWDVAWEGPVPVAIQRDTLPLYGFHSTGKGLRLCTLSIARNVLYSIIFERLKLSLGGTWMATPRSGLRKNKLIPEPGVVFQVNSASVDDIREFPVSPLDAGYFNLLDKIEAEMEKLLGLSPVMQGQAAGRADSPATYEQLIEQGGVGIVADAQLLEQTIEDWSNIAMWFVQNYYTHEHVVEIEYEDGTTGFTEASALAARGNFAVRVETGSTMAHSRSQEFNEAKEAAALGFYALPMLGKIGRIKHWRAALKQRAAIMADPTKQWMLGASGAGPTQQAMVVRAQGRRSHHRPGGK